MLNTGTIFQAEDILGQKYVYEFLGIDLNDITGCSYINLHNMTLNCQTDVEYAWFRERKIAVIQVGDIVKSNGKEGKVVKLHTGISHDNLEVLPAGKTYPWEGTEIWSWNELER